MQSLVAYNGQVIEKFVSKRGYGFVQRSWDSAVRQSKNKIFIHDYGFQFAPGVLTYANPIWVYISSFSDWLVLMWRFHA